MTLPDRIAEKIDASGVCWEWTAGKNPDGYGMVWDSERKGMRGAHRLVWELLVGEIPEGMTLDHLCLNKSCVNPDHLEVATIGENNRRRGNHFQAGKTHCPKGHPYDEENTYWRKDGRGRECKACLNASSARFREKRKSLQYHGVGA